MTETMKHSDGGTYTEIARAATSNGWAIAITSWTTYRGTTRFEVYRVSPENKGLRLHLVNTEREARDLANQEWKRDR